MLRRVSERTNSTTNSTLIYAAAAGVGFGLMGFGGYVLLFGSRVNKRREAISVDVGDVVGGRYELTDEIGSGGSCIVFKATDLKSKKCVAVKVVSKAACTPYQKTMILNEIEIMERLKIKSPHPNIVNMIEVIENSEYFFIVMDFLEGGELFHRLSERGEGFPEQMAKNIARQLIEATIYMHGQGIMHRDLKPENVVFTSKSKENHHVKIIDLGLAKLFTKSNRMNRAVATTLVGTTGYTAPEVYSSSGYGFAVDYFSIGVLIYVMLTCENLDEAAKGSIQNKRIEEIVQEKLNHVSEDARDIIRHLLDANPEERISVFEKTAIGWDDNNGDELGQNDKKFRYATRMGNLLLRQPWFVNKYE